MSATCPVTIGIGISAYPAADRHPVDEAVQAERLGFDFVSASDHPVGATPSFEVVAMLTSKCLTHTDPDPVATRVLGAPFQRPAGLAETVQTLPRNSPASASSSAWAAVAPVSGVRSAVSAAPPLPAGRKVRRLDEAIHHDPRRIDDARGDGPRQRVRRRGADAGTAPCEHRRHLHSGCSRRLGARRDRAAGGQFIPSARTRLPRRLPGDARANPDRVRGAGRVVDAVGTICDVTVVSAATGTTPQSFPGSGRATGRGAP